jgi:chromosome partitioning protein
MLGWLKRKAAPVPGERARGSDDGAPAGDERLERLLGRLGSEAGAAGEHAGAAVLEARPRPEPAALPSRPATPAKDEEKPAEDPDERVLNEIYPPALSSPVLAPATTEPASATPAVEDPEEAVLNEIYPEAAAKGEGPPPGTDPAAVEQSAAEAAAVIADIDRIIAGAAAPEAAGEPAPPTAESPAPATAAAEEPPAEESPAAATAEEAPSVEAPVVVPAVVMAALQPMREGDAAADEEPTPTPPILEPKAARRRAGKPPAAVERSAGGAGKPAAEVTGGFPPMLVIAVASQKGGAGKTTLAAHLAVRAGIAGHGPVVLIDTDPQGSLAEWWHARQDDTPALAVVKPEQLGANLAELRGYGTAVAIIDTPPALTGSIEQVIAMADLIVIPVRPSPHDLRAAGGTVEMARRAGKPFIFVVNGASPRASITAQAVAALSEHGRVAPIILYQRTEYAASMIDGRTVTEAAASGRSAQEIADLWQCVFAQIGMRAAA